MRRKGLRSLALAAVAAGVLGGGGPAVYAEGRQADSDDWVCNHGAPDDPTTIEACGRLRGTTAGIGRDLGHQRNSDDWNCNHGDPNATATLAACQRLRGSVANVGRDEGHQRNSDDWNCNHGAPGAPETVAACQRLRGGYSAGADYGSGFVIGHVTRELGAAHYAGGRAYRSIRYTVQFNCAAGLRRRVGYAYYAGHGATGARVAVGRSTGPWRRLPAGAATACG